MCGIIAVVRRRSGRPIPSPAEIDRLLATAARLDADTPLEELTTDVAAAAADSAEAARLLGGLAGLQLLLDTSVADRWAAETERIEALVVSIEDGLDDREVAGPQLEALQAGLISLKDAVWSIGRDRVRTARAVADLAGPGAGPAALEAFLSVQQALSALDRLEVRGRDSAGLHLLVRGHELDPADAAVAALLDGRIDDPLFRSTAVRVVDGGQLSFVYKAAAEIGELGDNTAALRAAITADEVLHRALASPHSEVVVLGHTRWASVGIISEPNAHPLNSDEEERTAQPYCTAVLNGDVDNFADLVAAEDLDIAPLITTDAKVIPTLTARRLAAGDAPIDAFRQTVAEFEGSVAIAVNMAADDGRLHLALRGSGQALYVGLAEDAFIVASEPYGVIEETRVYLRMDGETPGNPNNPTASRGQIIELDGARAGRLEGISRVAYDGTELAVSEDDLTTAEITTRDIDRGDHPHYLLKEMSEAPGSFRKTLRGKLVDHDGELRVALGDDVVPESIQRRIADGAIDRVLVIGQGTAAVAGQSLAALLAVDLGHDRFRAEAVPATELSGFGLRPDMSDTLVIAISQSGTTTDTNRTVDLVRARGASVVAIVNRRGSDLTDKVDGVLYTSDGRDVEMSVASTKAFYSQIAAGMLLAVAIADLVQPGIESTAPRQELLRALRQIPEALETVLATRPHVAEVAARFAPPRRYWAMVGNGSNYIAARELRIKLSELCYKSIACDATEDKKHIDLSSEPMILVCAAGLRGSTGDDVAKEVAIYRAHKAAPLVIADEGETRFSAALEVMSVPRTHPELAFVLATMVGHLFGYEAARAIDAQAQPLREARALIEAAAAAGDMSGDGILDLLRPQFRPLAQQFFDGLRAGNFNGHLEASTATRLASTFRYAVGTAPLESFQIEMGRIGTPSVVLDEFAMALSTAIDELTRPIDAIKHQAKTVTVGISRSDETLLEIDLPKAILATGAPRDRLSYRTLRTLADLDPAVAQVNGFIRYRVEGLETEEPTLVVVERGGIAARIESRVDRDPRLLGTKHHVATERNVLVTRGRRDGRIILIVPEEKDATSTGITLVHVELVDRLAGDVCRGVLQGYHNRYWALRDAVTETEPVFREDLLAQQPVVDLLLDPIPVLAERWRS